MDLNRTKLPSVVEQGLVPIRENQTVNARDLHEFLESKKVFVNWIKGRALKYGLVKGVDYEVIAQMGKNPQGGRPQSEYLLTIDAAKELAMVEGNHKGKQARLYFIDVEKRLKAVKAEVDKLVPAMSQAEIILASAQKLVQYEQQLTDHSQKLNQISTEVKDLNERIGFICGEEDFFTVLGYARMNNVKLNIKVAQKLGKYATDLSNDATYPIKRISDSRWGYVNAYHKGVMDVVFKHVDDYIKEDEQIRSSKERKVIRDAQSYLRRRKKQLI